MGHAYARHRLGGLEAEKYEDTRDFQIVHRAMKHFVFAARAGVKESLPLVTAGYRKGIVTKEDYETTLRSCHERQEGMKSDQRDKAISQVMELFD